MLSCIGIENEPENEKCFYELNPIIAFVVEGIVLFTIKETDLIWISIGMV